MEPDVKFIVRTEYKFFSLPLCFWYQSEFPAANSCILCHVGKTIIKHWRNRLHGSVHWRANLISFLFLSIVAPNSQEYERSISPDRRITRKLYISIIISYIKTIIHLLPYTENDFLHYTNAWSGIRADCYIHFIVHVSDTLCRRLVISDEIY